MQAIEIGDIIQYERADHTNTDWFAIILKIHKYENDFLDATYMWHNGKIERRTYHNIEFEKISSL